MAFVDIHGTRFHYHEKGAGIPFVFQHGMGGDLHQPQGFFTEPLPFRLLSFDFRGHGETEPVGERGSISFDAFADDLAAFLDHLAIDRAIIGGISMGAGVSLNFALRYPQRLRALILVRPAWLTEPFAPNHRVYPFIAHLLQEYGPAQGSELFRRSEQYRTYAGEAPQVVPTLLSQFTRAHAIDGSLVLSEMPHDVPNRDRTEWQHLRVPTLILANAADPLHPLAYGQTLAQEIPGAKFEEIAPRYTEPQRHASALESAVRAFIAGLSTSESI